MTSEIMNKQRVIIQFCGSIGHSPSKTIELLEKTFGDTCVSRSTVYLWYKRFHDGRTSTFDDHRTGRPSIFLKHAPSVHDALEDDRRITVREVAELCDIGVAAAHKIMTEELNMKRVCARWIPRLLTDEQMDRRVKDSSSFLRHFQRHGQSFLDRIITTDETWFYYYDPETKQQSSVWKHSDSPPPKKARVSRSSGKHMFIVFVDARGVILSHAVPAGQTVNASYYSKVVRRNLLRALRQNRPEKARDIENISLHQDNAPAHTADETTLELDVLGFQRIAHPPYSPDLAPLDFAVFPTIKSHLRGMRFDSLKKLRQEVQKVISDLDKDWFRDVFTSWVERHKKCIDCSGRYFEKE